MKLRAALGILSIVSLRFAGAEEPAPLPRRVRVDVEMVSVKEVEGLRLLRQLRRPESFEQGLARLQRLVASDEAELLGWPTLESQIGSKATSESRFESRFGTEYEPPAIPGSFSSPRPFSLADLIPRPFDVPNAFEVRNCGPTLEFEATIAPGTDELSLQIVAQHVVLIGMEPAIGARNQRPAGDQIPQPRFSVFFTHASLTLGNGGHVLLDTFNLEAPEPRMVFFILHASVKAPSRP